MIGQDAPGSMTVSPQFTRALALSACDSRRKSAPIWAGRYSCAACACRLSGSPERTRRAISMSALASALPHAASKDAGVVILATMVPCQSCLDSGRAASHCACILAAWAWCPSIGDMRTTLMGSARDHDCAAFGEGHDTAGPSSIVKGQRGPGSKMRPSSSIRICRALDFCRPPAEEWKYLKGSISGEVACRAFNGPAS